MESIYAAKKDKELQHVLFMGVSPAIVVMEFVTMKTEKELTEVNIDTIRELKQKKEFSAAYDMLQAWRKNLVKNRIQGRKEILSSQRKIERVVKLSNKLCSYPGCTNAIDKYSRCSVCREKDRNYYHKCMPKKAQIDWEPIIWVAVGICGIIIMVGLYKMTQPFWDNLLGGTVLSGVSSSLK